MESNCNPLSIRVLDSRWLSRVFIFLCTFFLFGCDTPPNSAGKPLGNNHAFESRSIAADSNNFLAVAQDVGLPPSPNNITLTRVSQSQLDVRWNPVSDVTSYRVYVAILSTSGGVDWVKYVADSTTFSLTDTLGSDVIDVMISVSAVNLAGEGASSPVVSLVDKPAVTSRIRPQSIIPPLLSHSPSEFETNVSLTSQVIVNYQPAVDIKKVFLLLFDTNPILGKQAEAPGLTRFTPNSLLPGTLYTAKVVFYRVAASGLVSRDETSWTFTTEIPGGLPSANVAALNILTTSPRNGDIRVALAKKIKLSFSEPVNSAGVALGAFVTSASGGFVDGTWRTKLNDAFFYPKAPLLPNVRYTVDVLPDVLSVAGNKLNAPITLSFTTLGPVVLPPPPPPPPPGDSTPPTLLATSPANNEQNVQTTSSITFTFSEPILASSYSASDGIFVLTPAGTILTGAWSVIGNKIIFTPGVPLDSASTYTLYVTPILKDLAGNRFAGAFSSTFKTAGAPAPRTLEVLLLTSDGVNPLNQQTNVSVNSTIRVVFSVPVQLATLSNTLIYARNLDGTAPPIQNQTFPGTWSLQSNGTVAIFQPSRVFPSSRTMSVRVLGSSYPTPVIGVNGEILAGLGASADFITAASTPTPPPPPVDTIRPVIEGLSPGLGSIEVPLNSTIEILFSEPISMPSVINGGIFVAGGPTGPVSGVWRGASRPTARSPKQFALTFTPSAPFAAGGTQYFYGFETDPAHPGFSLVTDLAGNAINLQGMISVVFSTVSSPVDAVRPLVQGLSPGVGTNEVAVGSIIEILFSEPILMSTVTNGGILLGNNGPNPITGTWSGQPRPSAANAAQFALTFTPSTPLTGNGTMYWYWFIADATRPTVGLVTDLAGNALDLTRLITIIFYTSTDNIPPTLEGLNPGVGSTNVPINSTIQIFLSEPMSMPSVQNGGILVGGGTPLTGTWSGAPHPIPASPNQYALTFTPAAPLAAGATLYWYKVISDLARPGFSLITDLGGNPMDLSGLPTIIFTTVP